MEKIGHMLKPHVPKFRPDLFTRLKDIAEKQVPATLKLIVGKCLLKLWGIGQIRPPPLLKRPVRKRSEEF